MTTTTTTTTTLSTQVSLRQSVVNMLLLQSVVNCMRVLHPRSDFPFCPLEVQPRLRMIKVPSDNSDLF